MSLITGIVTSLFITVRKKKKKHNKVIMLEKIKLNILETLISRGFINLKICHEQYTTIINEEEKYRRKKENIMIL